MSVTLTEEQIRQATQVRISQARAAVQAAQDALGTACQMLSALEYGHPTQKKASALYDKVKSLWYTVDGLSHDKRVRLDRTNIAGIERRLAEKEPQT